MSVEKYVLGIDGGGTKTEVICADLNGATVGQGTSGPTNITTTSIGAAAFNLIEAIRQALETIDQTEIEFDAVVMGLAGMDTEEEKTRAQEVFKRSLSHYKINQFILLNDSMIALENGTDNANAVVLISGTGSISYGRNQAGETFKSGGMDFLLTDQGSGYYIGRQVLREAVKSFDGRGPKTVLEQMVCEHFAIPSIGLLKNEVYNPSLSKIEVAQISHLCSLAMEHGDSVAELIFNHAIEELMIHVSTVIKKLNLSETEFDLVLSGAVMKLPHMQEQLVKQVLAIYPQVNISVPDSLPVYGAVKLALKAL